MNERKPKIVILDGNTLNPGDLAWKEFKEIGDVSIYNRSHDHELVERSQFADILLVNKVKLNEEVLSNLPDLKLVIVTATGYDNVDISYAKSKGIAVYNAVGYSTPSVAQHVFGLILNVTNKISLHNAAVHSEKWSKQDDFSFFIEPIEELSGLTLGLIGLGNIGKHVAKIGQAFGMTVKAAKRTIRKGDHAFAKIVTLNELLTESDIISLHVPLTASTRNLINSETLSLMKSNAILINTARGPIINESDLAHALKNNQIKAAGLDVLSQEPPAIDHPLFGIKNCVITPHHAWASVAARKRLMEISYQNILRYQRGDTTNRIV